MHEYKADCQCFRCKGIRNDPRNKKRNRIRKPKSKSNNASREEQHARYLDCGPQNWDDRGDC